MSITASTPCSCPSRANDRNAAAAGRNHQHAALDQRRESHPAPRSRRARARAPRADSRAPHLPRCASPASASSLPHRPANRTARSAWWDAAWPDRRRDTTVCVTRLDDGHVHACGGQFVVQRLRQQVSDFALAGGAANIQRLAVGHIGGPFRAQQLRAHLRPVAVRDHQAISQPDQADDAPRRCGECWPIARQSFPSPPLGSGSCRQPQLAPSWP